MVVLLGPAEKKVKDDEVVVKDILKCLECGVVEVMVLVLVRVRVCSEVLVPPAHLLSISGG